MPQPAWMSTYVGVSERIAAFLKDHPEGSIQVTVENFDPEQGYALLMAAAYREPEDPRPGIGIAYEARDHTPTEIMKEGFVEAAGTHAIGKALEALGYEKKTNGQEAGKKDTQPGKPDPPPPPKKKDQDRSIGELTEQEKAELKVGRIEAALKEFTKIGAEKSFWAILNRFKAANIPELQVGAVENVRKQLLKEFEKIIAEQTEKEAKETFGS